MIIDSKQDSYLFYHVIKHVAISSINLNVRKDIFFYILICIFNHILDRISCFSLSKAAYKLIKIS